MRIGVVGAGIAGLSCAYRLGLAGHDVVVYEREAAVGGRMTTTHVDGLDVDVGANILLANYARTDALVRELGLAWHELRTAGSGGVLRDEHLASFAPRRAFDVIRYRGLSWPARLRLLSFFREARRSSDALDFFDLSLGVDEHESADASSFLRAHYGDEIVEWLADPFIRTFHFHGAERLSMKYFDALAALLVHEGGFVPHGLVGQMRALPERLASRVPVRTAHTVQRIARRAGVLDVELEEAVERFDAVVLATTAGAARPMLREGFPRERALLDAIQYSSTVMCAFRVPRVVARDFEGIWVPRAESRLVCCCANETCKGTYDEDDCVFVIGVHDESVADLAPLGDDAVLAAVAEEWTRLFPHYRGAMHPLLARRWPEALPVYAPGVVDRVARFWSEGQGDEGLWLCGDYLNHPWVEGSIRCGEKVAAAIDARATSGGSGSRARA